MITLNQILALPGILEAFGEAPSMNDPLTFSTDTRSIKPGQSFIALDGERFKPMELLEQLAGCPVVIYNKNEPNDKLARSAQENHFFIGVKDTVTFLQDLGRALANIFVGSGGKLIAISGSNGKTTTKEMLFHLLHSVDLETVCTQKNNNNHIGVPLTLLQINERTRNCVLELGSNHPGEIEVLCDIAHPNIGVTTNIGDTHLEFFHNRENVFKEEGFLYYALERSLDPSSMYFINNDDKFLSRFEKFKGAWTYGSSSENDIVINASHDGVRVELSEKKHEIKNSQITGEHNFLNMGLAFAMAKLITNADDTALLSATKSFKPTANRSQWLELWGKSVFLDAYNANPTSMKVAIKGFKEKVLAEGLALEKAVLILGDMNELGDNAPQFHQEVGSFCKAEGFANVFFIGRFAGNYNAGCDGLGLEFSTAADLIARRKELLKNHKYVFIKGSRSLQLESITDIK